MTVAPFQKVLIGAELAKKLRRLVMAICDGLVQGVATSLILDAQIASDLYVQLDKRDIAEHCGLKDVSFRVGFHFLTDLGFRIDVIRLS